MGEGRGTTPLPSTTLNPMMRSTQEVFEDHLRLAQEGRVEEDLARNYAPDIKVLMNDGVHEGHHRVLALARRLEEEVPRARFHYNTRLVVGEIAYLEWTGDSEKTRVTDGADTFLIRDGKVQVQTIHYNVRDL